MNSISLLNLDQRGGLDTGIVIYEKIDENVNCTRYRYALHALAELVC